MQDIEATIDLYFKGSYEADASKLKRAFHPDAHITGNFKGEIVDWSLEQFIARLESQPSGAERGEMYDKKILSIDVKGAIALVKAQVVVAGVVFTDYISLLKLNEAWVIRHKSFDA